MTTNTRSHSFQQTSLHTAIGFANYFSKEPESTLVADSIDIKIIFECKGRCDVVDVAHSHFICDKLRSLHIMPASFAYDAGTVN